VYRRVLYFGAVSFFVEIYNDRLGGGRAAKRFNLNTVRSDVWQPKSIGLPL
jgi:hypothetical protein